MVFVVERKTMLTFMFSRLKDPRGGQGRSYPLGPLLQRAVLASLAGCDGIRSMTRWCKQHHEDLNLLLGTRWLKDPSHFLWGKLFHSLGETDFEPVLGTLPTQAGDVLHVDGKALCGSTKKGSPMAFMTSIFREIDAVALATVCHGKGEEGQAARAALGRLQETGSLKGTWLTFDALHTQKNS